MLLAMKKTQDAVEYGEDEISGSEELAVASTQYKQVVEKKRINEERVLDDIKSKYLTDGLSRKAREKVNITDLINNKDK